jgi:hypothetical protein
MISNIWNIRFLFVFFGMLTLSDSGKSQEKYEKYSKEETVQFWNLHLDKMIMNDLVGGKYEIPAINDRYKFLLDEIITKYGRPFGILGSISYYEKSKSAVACYTMKDLKIGIFIPVAMDSYQELKMSNKSGWEKQFEAFVIISFIHEVEHVAGGAIDRDLGDKKAFIEEETRAWSETCEHTISTFLNSGYSLDPSSAIYFRNWLDCGRENNECWRSFIEREYSSVITQNK